MSEFKARRTHRTQFTRSLNNFNTVFKTTDDESVRVAFTLLSGQMESLETANSNYVQTLYTDDSVTEEVIDEAVSDHVDNYKRKYLIAKQQFETRSADIHAVSTTNEGNIIRVSTATPAEAPYKRPTLDIPKFNGDLGKWLEFWSYFRQYDEDKNLSDTSKLRYLKSAMEPNSKAHSAIGGLPDSAEFYAKAVTMLKNRFGREKLLSEYYMRELLQMAIQNAMNKGKKVLELSTLYDKISTHIMALETLGIKIENYMIAIFPLVESSLPEETLRIWQRHNAAKRPENDDLQGNELEELLNFLRGKVENEEETSLALKGFSTKNDAEKKEKQGNKEKAEPVKDIPTASTLVNTTEKNTRCIFCDDQHQNHDTAQCRRAARLGMKERKKMVSENKCCFKCLRLNHRANTSRVRETCIICNGKHESLLCHKNSLNCAKQADYNVGKSSDKTEVESRNKVMYRKEENLASFCDFPDVYLQTLRVVLYNENREKIVRAVIDGGSERSYISSKVASELGYEPLGTEEIVHALFGGRTSKKEKHNIHLACMKDIDDTYACNFEVRDKNVICGNIRKIETRGCLLNELKERNISLCDLKIKSNDDIEVLIGMDICNKLLTGNKVHLSNGLTVEESKLGYVISGKVNKSVREDTAT